MVAVAEEVALVHHGLTNKFIPRHNGRWIVERPLDGPGAIEWLARRASATGMDPVAAYDAAQHVIKKARSYIRIVDFDCFPNSPLLVRAEDGDLYGNTWVKPALEPAPGDYPTIVRLLEHLCGHDQGNIDWLTHWLAAKVQNPALMLKSAVVLGGKPGGGKNTLSFIMQCMLGPRNCAEITRSNFESRFNSRWVDKLFVFADEVMTRENSKDVSSYLKILITSRETETEAKGKDQYARVNRMALMIASNDDTPVFVEVADRRYTVFANHDEITPDYKAALDGSFLHNEPTPAFVREIQGFWAALLGLTVDWSLIARPRDNDDRRHLIAASVPAHTQFFRAVDAGGFSELLARATHIYEVEGRDLGAAGVEKTLVYEVYKAFCHHTGQQPRRYSGFVAALRAHRPVWGEAELVTAGGAKPVSCWVLPRHQ